MRGKFLATSAAVALLVGTGVGFAQTPGGRGGDSAPAASQPGGGAPAGQRSSPTEGAAQPGGREGGEQRQGQGQRDRQQTQGQQRDRQNGQQQRQGQQQRDRQEGQQQRQGQQQRDRREGQQQRQGQQQRDRQDGQQQRQGQGRQQRDRGETTGAAPSNVQVTTEQRTRIREKRTVLERGKVTNVNFNVSVGTVVPRSVRIYDLPPAIVEIVPAYRGYKFVYVRDEVVIIDPKTLRIVAVIEV